MESASIKSSGISGKLGWKVTGLLLVTNMAGAGFLALPGALLNTGWLGVAMMFLFCLMVGFAGVKLGECWVILEERWPEVYLGNCRQPYKDIGERALGKHGGRLAIASVLITLIGGSTVFLALLGSFASSLIPGMSQCELSVILGLLLIPLTWLGTPKDLWHFSIAAVIATLIACGTVVVELAVTEYDTTFTRYPNPSILSFSLGFGAILFAFAGASIFPTVQNDMVDPRDFWKSVVMAFISLLAIYTPVALSGYIVFGSTVSSNILLNMDQTLAVKIAVGFQLANLLGTYLITVNPVVQGLEDIIGVPHKFGVKRVALRTSLVLVEILVVLVVPQFNLILQLVGGSTVSLCSFVLPPLAYMKLVDMPHTDPKWPKRSIARWERIVLWEIIAVGVVGGLFSTFSGFKEIIDVGLGISCFSHFTS